MYDYLVIGGGIVGLATGMQLTKTFPSAKIAVVEKESTWAAHQSGHNSGVIHSGIYYKPGSYKARLAREGSRSMARYCETNGIPFNVCGKLIVAAHESELPRLETLYKRGLENGLEVEKISAERAKEI